MCVLCDDKSIERGSNIIFGRGESWFDAKCQYREDNRHQCFHVQVSLRQKDMTAQTGLRDSTPNRASSAGRLPLVRWSNWLGALTATSLCNAPQDSGWINKDEVTHFPRPFFRRKNPYAVFLCNASFVDVIPPTIQVFHKQVHHEIVGKLLNVEVLQKKAGISVVHISEIVVAPRHRESEILIELLRKLEVLRRHKRLQFNGVQRAH